jgi:hypothetical protein
LRRPKLELLGEDTSYYVSLEIFTSAEKCLSKFPRSLDK